MQISSSSLRFIVPTLLCSLLAACGGGGSSSSTPTTSTPIAATPVVTAANYTVVAAQGWASTDIFNPRSGGNSSASKQLAIDSQLSQTMSLIASKADQQTGRDINLTANCLGGGYLAVTGQLDFSSTAQGANLTINAMQCKNDGVVMHGQFVMNVSQNPQQTSSVQFNNLSVSANNEQVIVDGDALFAINANQVSNISGGELHIVLIQNGVKVVDRTLRKFDLKGAGSSFADRAINGIYMVQHPTLGTVNMEVSTVQEFKHDAYGMIQSGSMQMKVAGSTVNLTAIGNNMVRLDYFEKNDGVVSSSKTMSWSQLFALQ